jgi:hypothetical protein
VWRDKERLLVSFAENGMFPESLALEVKGLETDKVQPFVHVPATPKHASPAP